MNAMQDDKSCENGQLVQELWKQLKITCMELQILHPVRLQVGNEQSLTNMDGPKLSKLVYRKKTQKIFQDVRLITCHL